MATADLNSSKFLTAVIKGLKQPNQLTVDNAANDNSSVVAVSNDKINQLKLTPVDTVMLEGKQRRKTCCIIVGNDCPNNRIQMNRVV
jgi:hypothetical protein